MSTTMSLEEGPDERLYEWHGGMAAISVLNVILLMRALNEKPRARDETNPGYETTMKVLCVPMVLVCGFRAWFCEDYASRDVWYDSPLNSILLHRCLAMVAELCWIGQASLAFATVGGGLPKNGGRYKAAAVWLFACIAVAECCSCAGTVTTNRVFFLAEESAWVVGFTVFLPFAIGLARAVPGDSAAWASAKTFARIISLCACVYVPWGWLSDLPSNYEAWQKDKGTHPYFGLKAGLEDAVHTRHENRTMGAWGHKLLWMTVYFSAAVWSSIALAAAAPRKRDAAKGAGLGAPLLVEC